MSMTLERFYKFSSIIEAVDCLDYAKSVLGLQPVDGNNHFNCPWRPGSDSGAFQISSSAWTDHTKMEGDPWRSGSIIHLVAELKYNGDEQLAQQELGDYAGLEPEMEVGTEKTGRAEKLANAGYEMTDRYEYRDENNKLIYVVDRYEHPQQKKEFHIHKLDSNKLGNVSLIPYRLPELLKSKWCCICEGEKDVDNLYDIGVPATTNPAGAGAWREDWNKYLKDKPVAILEDNDEEGKQRTAHLCWKLKNIVSDLKVITFSDMPENSDVSDFLDENGAEALKDKISQTEALDKSSIKNPSDDYEALIEAKKANKWDFKNYIKVETDDKPKTYPRHENDMIKELKQRFLGFPCRQGYTLFDHDRHTDEIRYLQTVSSFISWIRRKSKKNVRWARIEGAVTKEEFFEGVRAEAVHYEAISHVPDWPLRDDVYYTYRSLPKADKDHRRLWELVDFFNPLTPEDRVLTAAFLASPIYYHPSLQRPLWIIDSNQKGAGKSTLAYIAAYLFGDTPIEVKQNELRFDMQEIIKQCVSPEGRQRRIFLLDNVTGVFSSDELSSLITAPYISGKPPYGRNVESRPNNLTYTVTSNDATVDDDLAIRAWYVKLLKPENYTSNWRRRLFNYVAKHRLEIFADIIDILENHEPFDRMTTTRCPEIEQRLLQPICETEQVYECVTKSLLNRKSEANIEDEWGRQIEDTIRTGLVDAGINPEKESVFIRSQLAHEWLLQALPKSKHNAPLQVARNVAAQGHCPRINAERKIWPSSGKGRRRGLMWRNEDDDDPKVAVDIKKGSVRIYDSSGNELKQQEEMPF